MLVCVLKNVEWHPSFHPLDDSSTPLSVVMTKNVSRLGQTLYGAEAGRLGSRSGNHPCLRAIYLDEPEKKLMPDVYKGTPPLCMSDVPLQPPPQTQWICYSNSNSNNKVSICQPGSLLGSWTSLRNRLCLGELHETTGKALSHRESLPLSLSPPE